jgi:predicted RNA polymerase sigma factor
VPDETDWPAIAALYAELAQLAPSPIIELNRGMAIAMAEGPGAGLEVVDSVAADPALASYHLLPSVRADLLSKLGRYAEARAELQRALRLTRNEAELALLRRREASIPAG